MNYTFYTCKVPKTEESVLLKRPKTLRQANKAEEFELLHSNNKLIRQRNLICSKSQATFRVGYFPQLGERLGKLGTSLVNVQNPFMELGKVQGPLGKNSSESNPRSAKLAPATCNISYLSWALAPAWGTPGAAQGKSLEGPEPIHRAGAPLGGARAVFS